MHSPTLNSQTGRSLGQPSGRSELLADSARSSKMVILEGFGVMTPSSARSVVSTARGSSRLTMGTTKAKTLRNTLKPTAVTAIQTAIPGPSRYTPMPHKRIPAPNPVAPVQLLTSSIMHSDVTCKQMKEGKSAVKEAQGRGGWDFNNTEQMGLYCTEFNA
jgi:hypothetical protein